MTAGGKHMLQTLEGVVLRERKTGEADRFLDVLTGEHGVLEIFVRGSKKGPSRYTGATQLLSFARLCFERRGERCVLNSAEPIRSFYDLRLDVEKLSLALYWGEVLKYTVSPEQPAQDILRLFVNSLHYLEKGIQPQLQLKAVFELRLLGLLGFMPDLVACEGCACYEHGQMRFLAERGVLLCGDCYSKQAAREVALILPPSILRAMRHILYARMEELFRFRLSEQGRRILSDITERYLLIQLDRRFQTLDFYKSMTAEAGGI